MGPDAEGNPTPGPHLCPFRLRFVAVGTHGQGVFQHGALLHPQPQPQDAVLDLAPIQLAPLAEHRTAQVRVPHLAGGQVAGPGVDRCCLIEEGEGGLVVRQGQVGLVEGFHRADVFPVALEEVALQVVARCQCGGNDLLAEVGGLGMAGKQIE